MTKRVAVIAPSYDGARIADVLAGAGYGIAVYGPDCDELPDADAIVIHAFADEVAALLRRASEAGRPSVLSCAPGADVTRFRPGGSEPDCIERVASFRADAYLWRWLRLPSAIDYALGEDRSERSKGPLRLTFLGHAGADTTRADAPDVGATFELRDTPVVIGRATESRALVHFTTAGARQYASVEASGNGALVRDVDSTTGVWIGDERVDGEARSSPGDELTVAGLLRFRLDGTVAA
jgi:hypothetical protein